MKSLRAVAAVSSILTLGHAHLQGIQQPVEPPILSLHDVQALEAAREKRRRRAMKRTKVIQKGGIMGKSVTKVIVDEIIEL